MIPEGITRSRAFRLNVARSPATETRPSRGPWLAIGLCCPVGSSLTTASSETLNPSPPLMTSRRGLLHPRNRLEVGIQRFPNLLRWTVLTCRLPYPGGPKSANDCCFLCGVSLHPFVTGSAATLDVSRLQSSLRAYFALMLRPASWLALLSRTFTFELSLDGSPRTNVEYDYVGKQSIPTTGLSPASPTALWAAEQSLSPRSRLPSGDETPCPFGVLFFQLVVFRFDRARVRAHQWRWRSRPAATTRCCGEAGRRATAGVRWDHQGEGNGDAISIDAGSPFWYFLMLCQEQRE